MKTIRLMVVSVAIHIFLVISLFLGIAHALKKWLFCRNRDLLCELAPEQNRCFINREAIFAE